MTKRGIIRTGSKLLFSSFLSLVCSHSGILALSRLAHYFSYVPAPNLHRFGVKALVERALEVDVGSKGSKRFRITAIQTEQIKMRKIQD